MNVAVFVGGSRRILSLPRLVNLRLESLSETDPWFFVGDAAGADRSFQQFFAARRYSKVVVYAVSGVVRNNLGSWDVHFVNAPKSARGFDFFSVKDRQMARDASQGLMIWDGKSRGTLANISDLLILSKPCAVFLSEQQRIFDLATQSDFKAMEAQRARNPSPQLELSFGQP